MLKVLLRKQILELLSGILTDRRTGKRRTGGRLAAFIVLIAFLAVMLIFSFAMMYVLIGATLVPKGYDAVYFTVTGVVIALIGIIGGMFSTYSILYCPKDNETLLAMPIPPSAILLSRMLSVYLLILAYTLTAFVPSLVIYFVFAQAGPGTVIMVLLRGVVMYFMLTVLLLALSCALGWLLALAAAHLGGKKAVSVISLLVSFGVYYVVYFQRERLTAVITADPSKAEATLKGPLYPFYAYGSGISGNWPGFAIFTLIGGAAFALALLLLSRSFIKLITMKKGAKKKVYVEKTASASSAPSALLRREIRRFVTDPLYLINSIIGSVMMIVLAVVAVVNTGALRELAGQVYTTGDWQTSGGLFLPAAIAVVSFISAMTVISASSVSLEGNRLWILQTMPVTPLQIVMAKFANHMIFAAVPAAILSVCIVAALGMGVFAWIFVPLASVAFTALIGAFGLLLETHNPKLKWNDESVAVKQNTNVAFTMLGGFLISVVAGALTVPFPIFFPFLNFIFAPLLTLVYAGLTFLFLRLSVRFWKEL